ncbi:transglycosylase domain-containing protein, partial [Klebsiella pneumoniae]|nr:transglycosylase domain-containing protein [Klebsiella pneumoniae]
EDKRFYRHWGVDVWGVARAAVGNVVSGSVQSGASTITQQVAKNFYLSSEKTFTRKFNEVLLAYKIEQSLSKDKILELYFNQIYLGQRAYGFASAAQIYFN